MVRKELSKKQGSMYYTGSGVRSGLEVMNFLFDLINYIAGYTHKYYEEMLEQISHEELI